MTSSYPCCLDETNIDPVGAETSLKGRMSRVQQLDRSRSTLGSVLQLGTLNERSKSEQTQEQARQNGTPARWVQRGFKESRDIQEARPMHRCPQRRPDVGEDTLRHRKTVFRAQRDRSEVLAFELACVQQQHRIPPRLSGELYAGLRNQLVRLAAPVIVLLRIREWG